MTTPRKQLVSVEATPYYHCVSRCVRRCFLCGVDTQTGQSYEHRRDWVEQKMYDLARIYCIDICAYAIMSNHYHLVVHINREKAMALSHMEVVERWQTIHKLPTLVKRWRQGQLSGHNEINRAQQIIENWRSRLWNLSWFMKELNYDIACRANMEDNCKGHFWESRFKSQALLDEKALTSAMAYVDLNPLRAGLAKTLEESEHTSVHARLKALREQKQAAPYLFPFIGFQENQMRQGIPLRLLDYLELVDWTARQLREGKARVHSSSPPVLRRFSFRRSSWLISCTQLESKRATAVGFSVDLSSVKKHLGKSRIHLLNLNS